MKWWLVGFIGSYFAIGFSLAGIVIKDNWLLVESKDFSLRAFIKDAFNTVILLGIFWSFIAIGLIIIFTFCGNDDD